MIKIVLGTALIMEIDIVDTEKKLKGVITLESIRQSLAHAEAGNIIIAHDIMETELVRNISIDSSLLETVEIMNKYSVNYLTIVDEKSILLGFLEKRAIDNFVSIKLIEIEQKIALMAS